MTYCVVIYIDLRSVRNTFKKNKFENAEEAAKMWLNVRVVVKICPELEARLCLRDPPNKPKRRLSASTVRPNKIKIRRLTEYVPQIDLNESVEEPNDQLGEAEPQADDDAPNLSFDFQYPINEVDEASNQSFEADPIDQSFDELIYDSSSESTNEVEDKSPSGQNEEPDEKANESSANTDQRDLADTISSSLLNLSKILARRPTIEQKSGK